MQPQHQPSHNHYHRDYHIRDPPPYPGDSRQFYTPGYRQSYSGSEASTDISLSSTENLSTSARQEPQGEETTKVVLGPFDPATGEDGFSLLSSLGLQSTQAVEVKSTNSSTFYVTGSMPISSTMSVISSNQELNLSGSSGYASQVPTPTPTPTPTPLTQYQKTTAQGSCLIPAQGSGLVYSSSPVMGSQMLQQLNQQNTFLQSQQQQLQLQNFFNNKQHQLQEMPDPSSLYLGQNVLQGGGLGPVSTPQSVAEQHQMQQNMLSQYLEQQSKTPPKTTAQKEAPTQQAPKPQMHQLSRQQPVRQQLQAVQAQLSQPNQTQVKSSPAINGYKTMPSQGVPYITQLQQTSYPITKTVDMVHSQPVTPITAVKQLVSSQSQKSAKERPRPSTAPCTGRQRGPPPLPLPPGDYQGLTGAKKIANSNNSNNNSNVQALEEGNKELRRSYEMLDKLQLTRSQPDLTRLAEQLTTISSQGQLVTSSSATSQMSSSPLPTPIMTSQAPPPDYQTDYQTDSRPGTPLLSQRQLAELDHAAIATRATQMVERLSEENRSLRQELEGYYNKVCKLQKLEDELQKVHDAHEALIKHSNKRENLDKVMRFKLEAEVKKVKETNKELTDQYHQALQHIQQNDAYNLSDPELKNELMRKDGMITKLITQNRDLLTNKDRLEIEIAAQRSTLEEHRNHIDILDSALSTAQSSMAKFDEELQKKKRDDETVQHLQQVLIQLKLAVERKENKELQVRTKLEDEIRSLKAHSSGASSISKISDTDEGIASDTESPTNVQSLIRQLQEKDEAMLRMEAEAAKWEQKYLEEAAYRQLAVDAASVPKDVRIAALEQNSVETERMIQEARSEKLKHLEEVYTANRKSAELEAKLKTVQAQLAEKDAMLKVLQRHSTMSRTPSVSSLFASPLHSPRPSLMSSPLSLSLCSSAISTPGQSASNSRQNSQLDTSSPYPREATKIPIHSKSNSTGNAASSAKYISSKDAQIRELTQKLAAQTALVNNLQSTQSSPEGVKKRFWQV